MMRSYTVIFAVFAVVLLFGCITPQPPANNTTSPPVISPAGNGTLPAANQSVHYSADIGDTVWVNYTLWVDGKVLDTTNATLANESGIYSPRRSYQPLEFVLDFNKSIIDGFVINVIGMRVNETVTFDVDPSRGYGLSDPRKVLIIPRYYNMSTVETLPLAVVGLNSSSNVSKGQGFNTPYGTAFIEDINDENVTLVYLLQAGQDLTYSGIPQRVLGVNNLTAYIEYMFEENQSYVLPHPDTGVSTLFKVTNKTAENITLDYNHQLAGKTLHFEVTLVKLEPAQ